MRSSDQPPITLLDLIKACRRGEESAQFALYKQFYAYTLTVSLHYCKDRLLAEEIVQDAFVKVFRTLDAFDSTKPFKPWLRIIVVRTAINHYQAQLNAKEDLLEVLYEPPGVPNLAVAKLQAEDLYRLLQLLPPAYRLVFNLHVLEGYSHREIAETLGISIGTSKPNLAKARRKLHRLSTPLLTLLGSDYIAS